MWSRINPGRNGWKENRKMNRKRIISLLPGFSQTESSRKKRRPKTGRISENMEGFMQRKIRQVNQLAGSHIIRQVFWLGKL